MTFQRFHVIQENMCGHRGLELDSDLQVYEISLTQQFRNHYEKIFGQLSDNPTPVGVANRRGENNSITGMVLSKGCSLKM